LSPLVFLKFAALVAPTHGSPETQNFENAVADAEGGEPLARRALE
jgi:hypothetical protein